MLKNGDKGLTPYLRTYAVAMICIQYCTTVIVNISSAWPRILVHNYRNLYENMGPQISSGYVRAELTWCQQ